MARVRIGVVHQVGVVAEVVDVRRAVLRQLQAGGSGRTGGAQRLGHVAESVVDVVALGAGPGGGEDPVARRRAGAGHQGLQMLVVAQQAPAEVGLLVLIGAVSRSHPVRAGEVAVVLLALEEDQVDPALAGEVVGGGLEVEGAILLEGGELLGHALVDVAGGVVHLEAGLGPRQRAAGLQETAGGQAGQRQADGDAGDQFDQGQSAGRHHARRDHGAAWRVMQVE